MTQTPQPSPNLFLVSRVSQWYAPGNPQPCPEARAVQVVRLENRRPNNTTPEPSWAIELNTLEEFLAFLKTHGSCVVETASDGFNELIIHDDYME